MRIVTIPTPAITNTCWRLLPGTFAAVVMKRSGKKQHPLNSSTWHWKNDTVTLGFKDRVLISKAFKTANREVLVEEGKWQASADRIKVTVIDD